MNQKSEDNTLDCNQEDWTIVHNSYNTEIFLQFCNRFIINLNKRRRMRFNGKF